MLDFSFSSRSLSKEYSFLFLFSSVENIFLISLFLIKTGERIFRFLLLLSKLEKMFSNFSFSSRLAFFGSRQSLCQNSAVCSIQKGLDNQITSKHIQAPQIRLNTTQIPSDTPRGTPQTSPDNTRRQQMPTDTNRHQQTPADTARLIKKHLAVSAGVCCRLLVSVAVCWCLLLSAGVLCCMEMSVGCLCGCLRVSEWYLWMRGVFGCVWELSVAESLQNRANYAILGKP